MDLYNYKQKIESVEKKIIEPDYSQRNNDLIFELADVLHAEGLSDARVLKVPESIEYFSIQIQQEFR